MNRYEDFIQTSQPAATDAALFALRVAAFTVFTYHGAQFLFGAFGGYGVAGTAGYFESLGIPFPTLSVLVSGTTMLLGGVVLLLGLTDPLSRVAALGLVVNQLVALTAHEGWDVRSNGAEFAATMGLVALALLLTGPGRLTVTHAARAMRPRPNAAVQTA